MLQFIFRFFGTVVFGLLAVILFRLVYWVFKLRRIAKAISRLPMDPKHWFWGHLHEFPGPNEAGLDYFSGFAHKYPKACGYFFSAVPKVIVYHPDTVKVILKLPGPKPVAWGSYGYGDNWIGLGLVTSSGERWSRNRKLINPAFHFDVLKQFIKVKNAAVDVFLEKCKKYAESGEYMDVFDASSLLTMDVLLRCIFSHTSDIQMKGNNPFLSAIMKVGELWVKRYFRPWEHSNLIYSLTKDCATSKKNVAFINNVVDNVIKEKREEYEADSDRTYNRDFLDILLNARDEDGVGLTDREIREEMNTFYFAGFDTTACALTWTFDSLAQHRDIQERCQAEIDSLMDGRDDEYITCEDLQNLKYLSMVMKESLRYHTPVPLIERELVSPLVIDGVQLEAGSVVVVNLHALHRHPDVWKDPTKFDPDRFLPENFSKMDHFVFLPFSGGPRICIGQSFAMDELKLVVARTLRRFSFSFDQKDRKIKKVLALTIKPKDGLYLKITKRF